MIRIISTYYSINRFLSGPAPPRCACRRTLSRMLDAFASYRAAVQPIPSCQRCRRSKCQLWRLSSPHRALRRMLYSACASLATSQVACCLRGLARCMPRVMPACGTPACDCSAVAAELCLRPARCEADHAPGIRETCARARVRAHARTSVHAHTRVHAHTTALQVHTHTSVGSDAQQVSAHCPIIACDGAGSRVRYALRHAGTRPGFAKQLNGLDFDG